MLEFFNCKNYIAKKEYVCDLCGDKIHCGEKYHRYSGKYDGDMFDWKYHLICKNIIDSYCLETDDNEYDNDCIQDWLHDKYCYDCKHGGNEDDDCPKHELNCPNIQKNYDKEAKNNEW